MIRYIMVIGRLFYLLFYCFWKISNEFRLTLINVPKNIFFYICLFSDVYILQKSMKTLKKRNAFHISRVMPFMLHPYL